MRKATQGSGSNQGPQATLAIMSLSLFTPLSSSNISAFCFFFLKRLYIWGSFKFTAQPSGKHVAPPYTLCPSTICSPTANILHRVVYLVQVMIQHCYIIGIQSPFLFGQTQDVVDPPFWLHRIFSRLYRSCVPPAHPKNL